MTSLLPSTMGIYAILLLLCFAMLGSSTVAKDLNVMDFGAVGDGVTDDSQAFMKAWEAVCRSNSGSSTLDIPGRTFLLKAVVFTGPCKPARVHVRIEGIIVAADQRSHMSGFYMGSWIVFTRVNGLTIDGVGRIDGKGAAWWKACGPPFNCPRPMGLKFNYCNNLQVSGLKLINSPARFVSVTDCDNSTFSNLVISNPAHSPNTDGIDITHSSNVKVLHSNIGVGDDCIAILGGSSYINITGVSCGPGHGISIGSMGKNGEDDKVEEVHVKDCNFGASTNGARIKTWQGGTGYARKITFENINLDNTSNPITIDQFYCPWKKCTSQTKAVRISDISFIGFRGTSFTDTAINIGCSQSTGCTGIMLRHINITSSFGKRIVNSSCTNAHGRAIDTIPRVDCLLP